MSARSTRPRAAVAALATASLLASGLAAVTTAFPAAADDTLVVLAGDLQSELGCAEDWAPGCTDTALAPTATEGVYAAELTVPAGRWEYKIAVGGTWDEAYGVDGGEANYALDLAGATDLRFTFDHAEGLVSLEVLDLAEGYTDADAALVAEPVRQP